MWNLLLEISSYLWLSANRLVGYALLNLLDDPGLTKDEAVANLQEALDFYFANPDVQQQQLFR